MEDEEKDSNGLVAAPIKTGSAESVLASLFRSIMVDLHINAFKFNNLINDYILEQIRVGKNDDRSSAKGNLKRELLSDKISWKVFCKGLRFLNIWKFEIRIRAHHKNGNVTEHFKVVNINKDPARENNLPFTPE